MASVSFENLNVIFLNFFVKSYVFLDGCKKYLHMVQPATDSSYHGTVG